MRGRLKKSLQINARITPEIREILDQIESDTGVKDQPLLKALIHALCTHYQKHGSIKLPIELAEAGATEHKARRAS